MKYRNGNREDMGNAEKERKKKREKEILCERDNSGFMVMINEKPTHSDTNFLYTSH